MLLTFHDVLQEEEHAALLSVAATAKLVSGAESASPRLGGVKHNEQLAAADPALADVRRIVGAALSRHSAFRTATLPKRVHSLRLSRYAEGMHYGSHTDAAIMYEGGAPLRGDLSFTLFLNAPEDYVGGELALETGAGATFHKQPARSVLCYPTGQLHRVTEVTEGERLVVVGWVQSLVRDAGAREALWDLSVATELVHRSEGKSRAYDLLVKTREALVRRWAEP